MGLRNVTPEFTIGMNKVTPKVTPKLGFGEVTPGTHNKIWVFDRISYQNNFLTPVLGIHTKNMIPVRLYEKILVHSLQMSKQLVPLPEKNAKFSRFVPCPMFRWTLGPI